MEWVEQGQNPNTVIAVAVDRAVHYLIKATDSSDVIKTLDKTANPIITECASRAGKQAESDAEDGGDDLPSVVQV